MKNHQRLGILIFNMAILSLIVSGASIYLLYRVGLQQQKGRLVEMAQRHARLLEGFADNPQDPTQALTTLKTAIENSPDPTATGEILVAKQEGDRILYILNQRNQQAVQPQPIPWSEQTKAQPTRQALEGNSGVMVGRDYREIAVIAAYEPVEQSNWAVVAKIDLDEFRTPYLRIFLIALVGSIVAGALSALIYHQLNRSYLKQLRESDAKHRAIIRNAAEGIIVIDDQAMIETFNHAAEQLFGYPTKEIIGKNIDTLMLSLIQGEVEAALFGISALSTKPNEQNGTEQKSASHESNGGNTVTLEKAKTTLQSPLLTTTRELMGQKQDGTIFPLEMAVSRLANGKAKRYILLVRDITERKQAAEALKKLNEELELRVEERTTQLMNLNEELLHEIAERNDAEESFQESEKRFRTLFHQTSIGIFQTNPQGQFILMNPKFSQMLGYSELELQQKTFQELTHPEDLGNAIAQFRQLLDGEITEMAVEQRYHCRDGSDLWVKFSGSVVRNPMAEVEYFLGMVEDISDRHAAQNALTATEATLSSFYNSTQTMMGVIEIVEDDLRHISDNAVSNEFFQLSAVTMENQLASEMGVPEDIRRYWIDHCYESLNLGRPVQFEYAYAMDGEAEIEEEDKKSVIRWLQTTVSPIPGQERFSYIVEDVTERRQQAEAFRQAKEQLENSNLALDTHRQEMGQLGELSDFLQASLTLEDAYDAIAELLSPLFPDCSGGVFVLNEGGHLVEAISTWGNEFNSETLFSPEDSWALRRGRTHWVTDAQPRLLSKHIHRDPIPAETLSIPLMAQGNMLGLLYLTSSQHGVINNAKRQFAETVAEQLAVSLHNIRLRLNLKTDRVHDPLTGLFNRRYLEECLERELYSASRQKRGVGVMMLDIDYFRNFNNTFGHEAGDNVLKNLAAFLERTLHNTDIAARYGGEELVIILPNSSLHETRSRAEQLREGVKHLRLEHSNQTLERITVSMGIAVFPEHGTTLQILLQNAEEALSRAKNEGRDRVCTIDG